MTEPARFMQSISRRHSDRFWFKPGTIGASTWLAKNMDNLDQVISGLVALLLGEHGSLRYSKVEGQSLFDRIVTCPSYTGETYTSPSSN